MSGNKGVSNKIDRRIVETRDILGDALIELMHTRPFEAITVQNVLDRAGVARSTFYAHYRDKEDLFFSDVEEFFEMMSTLLIRTDAPAHRLAPVEEFCAHLRDAKQILASFKASGKLADVMLLGRGCFARAVEQRMATLQIGSRPADRRAIAHALAGSLFSLIDWWIDHDMAEEPSALDALFHRIAWNGVQAGAATP